MLHAAHLLAFFDFSFLWQIIVNGVAGVGPA